MAVKLQTWSPGGLGLEALAGMNACSGLPGDARRRCQPPGEPVTMASPFPIPEPRLFLLARGQQNLFLLPWLYSTATSGDGDPKHAPCSWTPIELSIGAHCSASRPAPLPRGTVTTHCCRLARSMHLAYWIRAVAGPRGRQEQASPA
jgi:hypothetical protein